MVNHSYECLKCNNQFDRIVQWDQRYVKCECGGRAERSWTQRHIRRFSEPIVFHLHADGSYGIPGRADAATPAGAERVECWHMADYERQLGKMNASEQSKAQRRHDAGEQLREEQMAAIRKETIYRLNQASTEWERDMLRETLARSESTYKPLQHQRLFAEALEYDSRRD